MVVVDVLIAVAVVLSSSNSNTKLETRLRYFLYQQYTAPVITVIISSVAATPSTLAISFVFTLDSLALSERFLDVLSTSVPCTGAVAVLVACVRWLE